MLLQNGFSVDGIPLSILQKVVETIYAAGYVRSKKSQVHDHKFHFYRSSFLWTRLSLIKLFFYSTFLSPGTPKQHANFIRFVYMFKATTYILISQSIFVLFKFN